MNDNGRGKNEKLSSFFTAHHSYLASLKASPKYILFKIFSELQNILITAQKRQIIEYTYIKRKLREVSSFNICK